MTERLLSAAEVSRMYGIPEKTLRVWRSQKRGPTYYKLIPGRSGMVRYRASDIDTYLAQNTHRCTAEYA
jgi:predicted DNA-binding transcriptional regulator AlpA